MAVCTSGGFDDVEVIHGRPDLANFKFGVTEAKAFPPYVFSVNKNALLIHKIIRVELHWYRVTNSGYKLVRLRRPVAIAHTACGNHRRLEAQRVRTCRIPNPDAILCGKCHGETHSFGKHGAATKASIKKTRGECAVRLHRERLLK